MTATGSDPFWPPPWVGGHFVYLLEYEPRTCQKSLWLGFHPDQSGRWDRAAVHPLGRRNGIRNPRGQMGRLRYETPSKSRLCHFVARALPMTDCNVTGTPPCRLLSCAASRNAKISIVSDALTGGLPVLKNLAISMATPL